MADVTAESAARSEFHHAEAALGVSRRGQATPADGDAARRSEEAQTLRLWLGLILLTAVAARVLLFALGPLDAAERSVTPETAAHLALADGLSEHHSFTRPAGDGESRILETDRRPGYPLLLAVTGAAGLPLEAILLLQIALGAAGVLLTYALGQALLKERTPALVGAGIVGIHPAGWLAGLTLEPTLLFATLLLLGLWLATERRGRNLATAAMGGLALGLAGMVQPLTVLLAPALGLWMVASDRRLQTLAAAAVFIAAALAPQGLWMQRNTQAGLPAWSGVPLASAADGLWSDRAAELPERVVMMLTGHGVKGLDERLGLSQRDRLPAHPLTNPSEGLWGTAEPMGAAAGLAVAWSGMNAILLLAALVGLVLNVVRGRWAILLLPLGMLLLSAFTWSGEAPEMWRLPTLGLQALLATSVLLPAPERRCRVNFARFFERRIDVEAPEELAPRRSLTGRPI